jgi:endoglucanase
MDGATIYDRELFDLLRGTSPKRRISRADEAVYLRRHDAKAIQRTNTGVKTACVAAPVRYIHSPSCVVSLRDVDAVYALAKGFLEAMGGKQS